MLLRRFSVAPRATTLAELLVVSGLMLVILTFMAVSLTTARKAGDTATRTGDTELALRLAKTKLGEHLSRGRLLSPPIGESLNAIEVRPYRFGADGTLLLQPGGDPELDPAATIKLDEERLVLVRGGGSSSLLANLGAQAAFAARRLDLHLLQVDLRAGGEGAPAGALTIRYYLP